MKTPLACACAVLAICFALVCESLPAAAIKIDLNTPDLKTARVNERDYDAWTLKGGVSDSFTVDRVTFTMSADALKPGYYKGGLDTAKLVTDGAFAQGGLTLKISGLSAGAHTIVTYHNMVDNPKTNVFSPMEVYMNGALATDNLAASVRTKDNADSGRLFTRFTVGEGGDVTITFKAKAGAKNQTVCLNAIELDTPDPARQASRPVPANFDEHADADSGVAMLRWLAAADAVSHDVYIGADKAKVLAATKDSAEYKGAQSASAFTTGKLHSMTTYYWRVDETNARGEVTKGNVWMFRPRQLAFDGAEGHGRYARGGRGGKVVTVTSLDDTPRNPTPGSLRWALQQYPGEPLTVIFGVSGIIDLKAPLGSNRPYLTIAGQTAPGKGICIKGQPFGFSGAQDLVVRFMRVRVGKNQTSDGMGLASCNHAIIDHSSISWTMDEAFSSRGAYNISFQRNMISEALNIAGHKNYRAGSSHGYAASISGDIGSFHHNLLAHCSGRNWSLAGGLDADGFFAGRLDIFNNVVYNWATRTTDGGAHEVNFVGNYYKPGKATEVFHALNAEWDGFPGYQKYYCNGNIVEGHHENLKDPLNGCRLMPARAGKSQNPDPWADKPFFDSWATIHSARDAYKIVLSDAGANMPVLDDHDKRIIRETLTGKNTHTGSVGKKSGIPDNEKDVGGWEDYGGEARPADFDSDGDGLPDWWERLHGTNPHSASGDFSDANAESAGDGYTQMDHYLEWMAAPHYDVRTGSETVVDLAAYCAGFEKAPAYKLVSQSGNCAVRIEGSKAVVTGRAGPDALGRFVFSVTDRDGATMTRRIGVRTLGN